MRWMLPKGPFELEGMPRLMGIVNVTPDSFSDGGEFFSVDKAVAQGLKLAEQGADILDIGGESTRPGADAVSEDEELRRVVPVVERLSREASLPISIDTSKAAVAREAMAAGASIINDVTGFEGDVQMLQVAVETRAAVCLMHMQGSPRTMQASPRYDDVVADVMRYLADRRDQLEEAGIARERIALDPGIGFGKTLEHNLMLLREIRRFHELGCPLLVGHSRKSFIGAVLGDAERDRLGGTVGVSVALATAGVHILRVHDVAAVRDALMLYDALVNRQV